MMEYKFVKSKIVKKWKNEVVSVINEINHRLKLKKSNTRYKPHFIGSSSRMMVVQPISNKENDFDYDVNLIICSNGNFDATKCRIELLNILKEMIADGWKFTNPKEKKRTINITRINDSGFSYSIDIAIILDITKDNSKNIAYKTNPNFASYDWALMLKSNEDFNRKEEWIRINLYWNDVRREYLSLKSVNHGNDKESRSIYIEAINNVYNQIKRG